MIPEEIIKECKDLINNADVVLIGAGAGLSASAGLMYSGKRFTDNFSDFIERYNLTDMYSSAFYPWGSQEEFWGFFSRYINVNRYIFNADKVYPELLSIIENKPYFILTTNADALFEKSGFKLNSIFATQGDYSKFQCEKPCNDTLYYNEEIVKNMVAQQNECKVLSELIPTCPNCGANLVPHLRKDDKFVENADWHAANERFNNFVKVLEHKKVVLLELGVGFNTPSIIRWPFEQFANNFPKTTLIRVNMDNIQASYPIPNDSVLIQGNIAEFVNRVAT